MRSVHINFKKRDGSTQQVEAKTGMSLLQVAHANDIDLEGMQVHTTNILYKALSSYRCIACIV